MILVAGGTGRLGSVLVDRLRGRREPVRVLTRDPARAEKLGPDVDVVVGDVRDPSTLAAAVAGVDVVVSAVHGFIGPGGVTPASVDRDGNANLVEAARQAGAGLVLMSIVGASADSPMELFRMKYAAEQHALASGVPTTVVRSTAFFELWIELMRQTAGRSGRPLVFGRGENPINFVSVVDVAALVDHVVRDDGARGRTFEIGGPVNLTFNELARAVMAADDHNGGPRHVPPFALRLMGATVGRVKPELGRQAAASLAMDRIDLAFDAGALRRTFPDLPCTSVRDVLQPGARL